MKVRVRDSRVYEAACSWRTQARKSSNKYGLFSLGNGLRGEWISDFEIQPTGISDERVDIVGLLPADALVAVFGGSVFGIRTLSLGAAPALAEILEAEHAVSAVRLVDFLGAFFNCLLQVTPVRFLNLTGAFSEIVLGGAFSVLDQVQKTLGWPTMIRQIYHNVLKLWVLKFWPIHDSAEVSTHSSLRTNPNPAPTKRTPELTQESGLTPKIWINRKSIENRNTYEL